MPEPRAGLAAALGLAATPTFLVMALLSAQSGGAEMICGQGAPISGMAAMYLLMSAFHLTAWLKRWSGAA